MRVSKSALVGYSARQMYDLVNDIDAYQEFLPWCLDSAVLSRHDNIAEGRIELGRKGISQQFSTRNELVEGESITVDLVEGPFKHLRGSWQFQPLGDDACKVLLDMDFEFSGSVIKMAFGPIFSQVVDQLIDSFIKRAEQVYG